MLSKVLILCVVLGALSVQGAKIKCGSTNSKKSLTFSNPDAPPNNCIYKIKAANSRVCQLRIQLEFNLSSPTIPNYSNDLNFAECLDDFVQIGEYKFCGRETDQHIYIPFSEQEPAQISISTSARSGGSPLPNISWNIKTRQIECSESLLSGSDADLIAPVGCLQYFPKPTGVINSFNFNEGLGTYNGNLTYAICLNRNTTTQGVRLTGNAFRIGTSTNTCEQGPEHDFLLIPMASLTSGTSSTSQSNIFCGAKLKSKEVISKSPGPISFIFHSGDSNSFDSKPKGFSLNYELI